MRISFSVLASPSEAIMDALLQLKGIDKSFPGVKALSGAALNVYSGRVMALVGVRESTWNLVPRTPMEACGAWIL